MGRGRGGAEVRGIDEKMRRIQQALKRAKG
jgi:hypothetical protein